MIMELHYCINGAWANDKTENNGVSNNNELCSKNNSNIV